MHSAENANNVTIFPFDSRLNAHYDVVLQVIDKHCWIAVTNKADGLEFGWLDFYWKTMRKL